MPGIVLIFIFDFVLGWFLAAGETISSAAAARFPRAFRMAGLAFRARRVTARRAPLFKRTVFFFRVLACLAFVMVLLEVLFVSLAGGFAAIVFFAG